MRFLADENCDFAVVRALREAGFDVTAVRDVSPGATDNKVIELAVFHTYSHPDVIRPGEMVAQLKKPFGPFGQHLKNISVRLPHDIENALDEITGNVPMEKIANRAMAGCSTRASSE